MAVILRKSLAPKCLQDAAVTGFVLVITPVMYYFELFIVLPTFFGLWSCWHIFHFICGTFILCNICANLVAIMMVDTSINGRILPTKLEADWRFCATCESIAPPRSWHCNICDTCIIKRDHHCVFTSCCIGHHNQRYFVAFVFYMFIATMYANYFNLFFIIELVEFNSWKVILKIFFPLVAIMLDYSLKHLYLFLFLITGIGSIFTGTLLIYHMNMIIRGVVTHERAEKHSKYDLGWRKNLELALGDKWHLILLMPFVESKLLHDGIYWDTKQSLKAK